MSDDAYHQSRQVQELRAAQRARVLSARQRHLALAEAHGDAARRGRSAREDGFSFARAVSSALRGAIGTDER